ncbi:MAG: sensor histidine kinase [Bifidobacteriaceae bacterium]|jgi:signal transduction histidine kinase|nr:sensor histidine kinase [Bifidobacteriaceae bacterium]
MPEPGVDAARTASSSTLARDVAVGITAWAVAMLLGTVVIAADPPDLIQYAVAAALLAAAIAVRRLAPTAAGVAAAGVAAAAVGWLSGPGAIVAWLALPPLYTLTRWGKRSVAYSVGPAVIATSAVVVTVSRFGVATRWTMTAFLTVFTALLVWGLGTIKRRRGERQADASRRHGAAEREREQLAQLAAASERNRIAREMHDIVAHSLSVIIAQADGGSYASHTDPQAATRALGTIAETGRAALADMRHILGVLRHPEEADTGALRAPVPDSQDLDALAAQMRDAGLDIAMVRIGVGSTLPPGVGLALYRICQEALTNVLKHAGPGAHVTVIDRWEPHQVALDIHDDGRGAAATSTKGPGHGLVGMRERAEMLGGTLDAGPARAGGFRVTARIPLPSRRIPAAGQAPMPPDTRGDGPRQHLRRDSRP